MSGVCSEKRDPGGCVTQRSGRFIHRVPGRFLRHFGILRGLACRSEPRIELFKEGLSLFILRVDFS